MKKILLFPFTCNPPHLGHVSTVTVALEHLEFDEMWILPSGKRVDKEISTSFEDIKNLAILYVEYLRSMITIPVTLITTAVDDCSGRNIHEIIIEMKARSGDELYQLCGTDGYTGIKERIIGPNEKFVIIKRPGYEFPEGFTPTSNLVILDGGGVEISSTRIREMVKNGDQEYKKLVPERIAAYIEERGLYL